MGRGVPAAALFFSKYKKENYILDFKYVSGNDQKARIKTLIRVSRSVTIILKTFYVSI